MIGHKLLARAQVPGGVELRLMRRGKQFTIVLDGNELMSTRGSASEEALATMTWERLGKITSPHLLIGGYGLGYTLRAALNVLGEDASITVAELVPEIIEWARGPMRELTGACLEDDRVVLIDDDVAILIEAAECGYDAILLDVDNGPDGLTRRINDHLYSLAGLKRALRALKPNGILAIWSAEPDPAFADRLSEAGFEVSEVRVRELANGRGARHVIWFGQKLEYAMAGHEQASEWAPELVSE